MFGRNLSNRVRMKKVIVGDSVQLHRAVTQVVLATENDIKYFYDQKLELNLPFHSLPSDYD